MTAMKGLEEEIDQAKRRMMFVIGDSAGPLSIRSIIKKMPNHREDAVRFAFWSLVQDGKILLNKQYRAKLA